MKVLIINTFFSMQKNTIVGIIAVLIIAIGIFTFQSFNSTSGNTSLSLVPVVYAQEGTFTFKEYNEAEFNADQGKKVIFFGSAGCGSCAKKHKDMTANTGSYQNATVYRIEFEKAPTSLREQYGITKWDTLVVFETDGTYQVHAGIDVEEMKSIINS